MKAKSLTVQKEWPLLKFNTQTDRQKDISKTTCPDLLMLECKKDVSSLNAIKQNIRLTYYHTRALCLGVDNSELLCRFLSVISCLLQSQPRLLL